MQWFLWTLAVVILGVAAVAASGRLGGLPEVVNDTPRPWIPAGDLDAEVLRNVRFAVVTRGYSMEQVDALLDRLADQLSLTRQPPSEPLATSSPARPETDTAPGL